MATAEFEAGLSVRVRINVSTTNRYFSLILPMIDFILNLHFGLREKTAAQEMSGYEGNIRKPRRDSRFQIYSSY